MSERERATAKTPRCRYCDGELEPEDIALGFTDAHRYCDWAERAYDEYQELLRSESDPSFEA